MTPRMRAIGIATAVMAALASAAFLLPDADARGGAERPRTLLVENRGLMVKATAGSYCVTDANVGLCADSVYPLRVRGRLPVAPGERLKLRTHDRRIATVGVSLLRVSGDEVENVGWHARARRAPGHQSRWLVRLPGDLGGANRLDVFMRYEGHIGDADYWAGLAPQG
jgi:hypothetical protein